MSCRVGIRLAMGCAALLAGVAGPAGADPGDLWTVAGGGPPGSTTDVAITPTDVVGASDGTLYIADPTHHVVWRRNVDGTVERYAGTGAATHGPDGVPATVSGLTRPTQLLLQQDGTLLVASEWGRVRAVSPTGVITAFAGTGAWGSTGNGGPATAATFGVIGGLASDPAGNTYIADDSGEVVRKVTPDGTIHAFAGDGTNGFSGDGGPALAAQLHGPGDLAVAPDGALIIADRVNYRIRRVAPNGTISTIAGTGSSSGSPDGTAATSWRIPNIYDMAVDSTGRVLVSHLGNRVHRFPIGGVITTVAGNGASTTSGDGAAATVAGIPRPEGIALVGGSLVISTDLRLRAVDPNGTIATIAGNGRTWSGTGASALEAQLDAALDVDRDPQGRLVVLERYGVRRVELDGTITHVAGRGVATSDPFVSGVPVTDAVLQQEYSIAVADDGTIFVGGSGHIRKIVPGDVVTTFAGGTYGYSTDGAVPGRRLTRVTGIDVDAAGNVVFVDGTTHRVRIVTPDAQLLTVVGNGFAGWEGDGGPAVGARLTAPEDVAVTDDGGLLVADTGNQVVRRVDGAGTIATVAGTGIAAPIGAPPFGPAPATAVPLSNPASVDDLGAGAFIVDSGDRVVAVSADGMLGEVVGPGAPVALAEGLPARSVPVAVQAVRGGSSGDLLVVEGSGNRVWRVERPGPPLAPDAPAVTPGIGSLGVEWSAVHDDGGVVVDTYVATATPGGATCKAVAPIASCTITGLVDGTPYDVSVVASNAFATSAPSPTATEVPGARLTAVTPTRVLDTRDGTGGSTTRWGVREQRDLPVAGVGGVPTDATAVVLNLTAVGPTESTHLTVWPTGDDQPLASNLNVPAGAVRPNLVTVGLGEGGGISIANHAGSVHLVADVVGWYGATGDGPVAAVPPRRLLDSRDGTGGHTSPWPAASSRTVRVRGGTTGVPAGASAVLLNVTGVAPTAQTFLTVHPAGAPLPLASNLNLAPGETAANLVVAKVGDDDAVTIYNNTGSVHVVADVVGYVDDSGSIFVPVRPARLADSRDGTGGLVGPWAPGATRSLVAAGGATPVPADATAVVVNITGVSPTTATHLTVWPTGSPKPVASTLNLPAGAVRANAALVPVGTGGRIDIANNAGQVHVVVDVVGYLR